MSDYIKVNRDRLKHDTEVVEELIDDVREKMSDLESAADSLRQIWSGEASKNFQSAFREDIEALCLLCENLQKISEYEEYASRKYAACEQQAEESIAELSV